MRGHDPPPRHPDLRPHLGECTVGDVTSVIVVVIGAVIGFVVIVIVIVIFVFVAVVIIGGPGRRSRLFDVIGVHRGSRRC